MMDVLDGKTVKPRDEPYDKRIAGIGVNHSARKDPEEKFEAAHNVTPVSTEAAGSNSSSAVATDRSRMRKTLAGMPPTVAPSGTSCRTTALAPMRVNRPMRMGPM